MKAAATRLRPAYLVRLLDATSQWLNVALFNGDANESISGRAYREGWMGAQAIINTLFAVIEHRHCEVAHWTDVERARVLSDQYHRQPL